MHRVVQVALWIGMLVALAPPAAAEQVSTGDPTGDTPDITRIVLDNREKTVIGRVKYTDVAKKG